MLPVDLAKYLLEFLDPVSLIQLRSTCSKFRNLLPLNLETSDLHIDNTIVTTTGHTLRKYKVGRWTYKNGACLYRYLDTHNVQTRIIRDSSVVVIDPDITTTFTMSGPDVTMIAAFQHKGDETYSHDLVAQIEIRKFRSMAHDGTYKSKYDITRYDRFQVDGQVYLCVSTEDERFSVDSNDDKEQTKSIRVYVVGPGLPTTMILELEYVLWNLTRSTSLLPNPKVFGSALFTYSNNYVELISEWVAANVRLLK